MKFPTPSAYQDAVQHPPSAFRDPALREAEPVVNALGLPQPITGAAAVVFRMETGEGPAAVRCFLTDQPGRAERYAALARRLETHPLPYFLPFDFQPEGIRIGEAVFPFLKMRWGEGLTLNRYVASRLDRPARLEALADRWVRLLDELSAAGIAHGDLQHGNVLVREEGDALELTLVDYDAVYVPEARRLPPAELGHRNYQHPDRSPADFDASADRFPGLLIYTAVRACALDASLWARYDTGENLLFTAADLFDPAASSLFEELLGMTQSRPEASALRQACYLRPGQAPSVADALAGRVDAAAKPGTRRAADARGAFERYAAGGPALLAALVFAAWQWAGAAPALGVGTAGSALLAGVLLVKRRAIPAVRRRRRLLGELEELETLLGELRARSTAVEAERETVRGGGGRYLERRLAEIREEALRKRLRHHFVAELTEVEGLPYKLVIRLRSVGIRNAFQATEERLGLVTGISEERRAEAAAWRRALVARYEHELPRELPPSEVRRVERQLRQRIERLDAELARLAGQQETHRREQARVAERLAGVPEVSAVRYLLYLLRLRPLPPGTLGEGGRP